jgi:hypothetical protein
MDVKRIREQKRTVLQVLFAANFLSLSECVDAVWKAADFSNGKARHFCSMLSNIAKGGEDLEAQLKKLELDDLMKFVEECIILTDECWYREVPFLARATFGIERRDRVEGWNNVLVQVDQEDRVERIFTKKHELKRFLFEEVERILYRS